MITILKRLKEEKKFVCIHTDRNNPSKFIFGKIIGVDEAFFAMSMVSPDGDYDGVIIKLNDDIVWVEQSVSYENKMIQLMQSRGYSEKEVVFQNESVLLQGLYMANKKKELVSVELDHSGVDNVVGYVQSVDVDKCKMIQVDEYGQVDGISYFALRDFTQICFDSCDERRLSALIESYAAK